MKGWFTDCCQHELAGSTYQNSALGHGVLKLFALDNFVFFENFEGVILHGVLFLDEKHLAVAAFANDRNGVEVLAGDLARLLLLHLNDVLVVADLVLAFNLALRLQDMVTGHFTYCAYSSTSIYSIFV